LNFTTNNEGEGKTEADGNIVEEQVEQQQHLFYPMRYLDR